MKKITLLVLPIVLIASVNYLEVYAIESQLTKSQSPQWQPLFIIKNESLYPRHIAVDNGLVYVADFWKHHIQVLDIMGNPISSFGIEDPLNNWMLSPRDVAVDNGLVYVAYSDGSHVEIFNREGNLLGSFDNKKPDNFHVDFPDNVFDPKYSENTIWERGSQIKVFDMHGNLITKFDTFDSETGSPVYPEKLEAYSGLIYVLDSTHNNIVVYDQSGNTILKFGTYGFDDGQFRHPQGLAIGNSRIYVVDTNNARIQIFDMSGNFVKKFEVQKYHTGGFPNDLTVDENFIYLIDTSTHHAQIYDNSGNVVIQSGTSGKEAGQFIGPTSIVYDNGLIYIADGENERIQIFSSLQNEDTEEETEKIQSTTSRLIKKELPSEIIQNPPQQPQFEYESADVLKKPPLKENDPIKQLMSYVFKTINLNYKEHIVIPFIISSGIVGSSLSYYLNTRLRKTKTNKTNLI